MRIAGEKTSAKIKMKTKTKIGKQVIKKKNQNTVATILESKKHKNWLEIASILSSPRRKTITMNLEDINKKAKEGEKILVPGKVLSLGELDKKIKVIALNFSERAKEKVLKSKSEVSNILEEIKKNPNAEGINILK